MISIVHVDHSIQIYMNANDVESMWQDVNVSDDQNVGPSARRAGSPGGQPPIPEAAQVEILKALAAPTRLRIMYALEVGRREARVMSVKELAEELGEPQTRLYRHVKVLESAGLIEVAATRMVSGILEQRYRAIHRDLQLGPIAQVAPEAAEAAVNTMVQMFSQQFFDAYREGRLPNDEEFPEDEAYRRPKMVISSGRIAPARANSIRSQLEKIVDELSEADDPNGVPVNAMIAFYSPSEPDKT
jgi:DNA-binding transcriptional ArsR family regulator